MVTISEIKVTGDYLVLKASPLEEVTDSGLVRPEAYEQRSESGVIVAMGPDVKNLKKGDSVFFNKYATIKLNLGVDEFIVLKQEDVIAYLSGTSS